MCYYVTILGSGTVFSLSLDDVISTVDVFFVLHFCRVTFLKNVLRFELVTSLLQLLLKFSEDFSKQGIFITKV